MTDKRPINPRRRKARKRLIIALVTVVAVAGAAVYFYASTHLSIEEHMARAESFRSAGDLRAAVIELKNVLQAAPDNRDARWMIGQFYLSVGDGASAQKEIERARELGKKDAESLRALLRAMLLQGRYEAVLGRLVEQRTKDDPGMMLLSAQAHLGLRHFDRARDTFQKVLAERPDDKDARLGLTRVAMSVRDTAEAQKQIDLTLERDDADLEALLLKGELDLSRRNFEQAQASYEKVLKHAGNNLLARVGIIRALLARRKPDAALEHIGVLLDANPKNPIAHYLKALAEREKNNLDAALESLREVLRVAPNHAQSLLLAGSIHYIKRDLEQAEELLGRHLVTNPESLPAIKLMAAINLRKGDADAAIARLLAANEIAPDDAQVLALLGSAYMASGDQDQATKYLEKAAALQPKGSAIKTQLAISHLMSGDVQKGVDELKSVGEVDPEFARADFLLALVHLRNREFDEALEVAERLSRQQPENPIPVNLLGAGYEGKGDQAAARKQYERALALNPKYTTAALNLARMDFNAGDIAGAKARYQKVVETQPKNDRALAALAQIAQSEGKTDDAVAYLEKARSANPKAIDVRLALANYHARRGNIAGALDILEEAAKAAPDHPNVLLALGTLQLATGDSRQAVTTYQKFVQRYPKVAPGHYQLGLAMAAAGDLDGAKKAFEDTLEADNEHLGAENALGRLALRSADYEQALDYARRMQTEQAGNAGGFVLQGDILAAQGAAREAGAVYEKALALSENGAIVVKLSGAQRAAGDAERARQTLNDWLDNHPKDVTVRVALASNLQSAGTDDEAARQYEQVLQVQPNNVLALNNLAWIYHESDRGKALSLARQAYELLPQRAEIADTYGWMLVENGKIEQGLALLEKALKQAPDNADIRYHWASGLNSAGETERAKGELESILGSGQPFMERKAAESLLRKLRDAG